jgi:hypothetical protein
MREGIFDLIVRWEDGEQQTVSAHDRLDAAARQAFRLADALSIPRPVRRALEVAIVRFDQLELSIAIVPGERLPGPD